MSMNSAALSSPGALPPGYGYDANGDIVYLGGEQIYGAGDPNYDGMPATPSYNPVYNPSTDGLAMGLDSRLNGIDTNPLNMSVQNFADLANRKGPSSWAVQAGDQQDALAANELEKGASENNAQTAQALDTLGASGGISSGARERAAEGGAKNYMNMSQNVGRQDTLNHLQIGVNDEQNKMQEMGMLPGMETQALQPQFQKANMWEQARAGDVNNAINANKDANAWNQNTYNQQMQAWGANQQANATANSGKK